MPKMLTILMSISKEWRAHDLFQMPKKLDHFENSLHRNWGHITFADALVLTTVTSSVLPDADGGRGVVGFTSGRRPNRGGLLLKEKAALRKLEKAQVDLKAARQRRDCALRAGGRAAGTQRGSSACAQPVYTPLSDSEVVPGLMSYHKAGRCHLISGCFNTLYAHAPLAARLHASVRL